MKYIRIICLILALITVISLVGCNSTDIPAETTEAPAVNTGAPEASEDATVEETEPTETEPPFEIYEGPSADFKFTLENVLGNISYDSYKDFVANGFSSRAISRARISLTAPSLSLSI